MFFVGIGQSATGVVYASLLKAGFPAKKLNTAASEVVAVDIFCGSPLERRIICAYFSPTGSSPILTERMRLLCDDLDKFLLYERPVIIVGDFNLPNISWADTTYVGGDNCKESIFLSFCIANDLTQLVKSPTRPVSSSTLDLLLTSNEEDIVLPEVVPCPVKSDHLAVKFRLSVPKPVRKPRDIIDYSKSNFDAISSNLLLTNWNIFFQQSNSVDAMYISFVNLLTFLIKLFTPVKVYGSSLSAFVNRGSQRLHSVKDVNQHTRLSKAIARAATRLRLLQEKNILVNRAADFFRYANQRLRSNTGVAPLLKGSSIIVNNEEKAEALRDHFSSVYVQESDLLTPPITTTRSTYLRELNDIIFSPDVVLRKLRALKAKCSITPDGLPPVLLKSLAESLAEPLSIIFTRSFEEGEVPDLFRKSLITPVFKKGARSSPKNYRPIAQECMSCLVMEDIVSDAIVAHCRVNNLFDENQHGFTKGRSTSSQLLEVAYDWILAKNHSNPLHCVYFDFSCAFDLVDHERLLAKMEAIGLGPRIGDWCAAYLRDRTFRVRVGEAFSSNASAPSGVPQGSRLGPLLYLIFSLDLKRLLRNTRVKYKLYADDLKLYAEIKSQSDISHLQKAIDIVGHWVNENKMKISTPKCGVLKTRPDNTVYTLHNVIIPSVSTYRDLGITFDVNLRFRVHIVEVAKAAARWCNMICRTFIIIEPTFYIRLYQALVVPKLSYCAHVWRPYLKKDTNLLQAVQNRFVKRIAWKCNVPRESIELEDVELVQARSDLQMLPWLTQNEKLQNFFNIYRNELRSTVSLRTHEIANNDIVNNSFFWRVERRVNADDPLYKQIITPFLNKGDLN